MRALVLVAAFEGVLTSTATAGGAWVRPADSHYLKVWTSALVGERGYFASGEVETLPDGFQQYALHLYGEYGLDDDWTVVGSWEPVGEARIAGERTSFVGPLVVGARRRILDGPLAVAVEGRYGYTSGIGDRVLTAGSVDGSSYEYRPVLETHRFGGSIGAGWGLASSWLGASAGLTGFTRDSLDPVIDVGAEAGWKSEFGLVASIRADLHHPLGAVSVSNVSGAGQTRYLGINASLSYWFDEHVAVTLGAGGAAFAQANAATPALSLGIELR